LIIREGLKMYCVVRGTTKVINSNEPEEIMLQNAQNAGLSADEVEILTEEEYRVRKEAEPRPPQPKTKIEELEERIKALENELASKKL
jgi:hypothetical protein